jgi:hypothetical protein
MTVNLGEHQVGFDANKIGFPSIHGCMAMVVVIPGSGLYGYHIAGGETEDSWNVRAPKFRDYITSKNGNPANATRLYGVAHVDNQRGWGLGIKKDFWKAELRTYAALLGTNCRISGYNLDDAIRGKFHQNKTSAYVEFRRAGDKCNVFIETWTSVGYTKLSAANNPWGDNIKAIRQTRLEGNLAADLVNAFGDIYDPINPSANLRQIHKTKLSG